MLRIDGKLLSQLSDEELEAELWRRRRDRGQAGKSSGALDRGGAAGSAAPVSGWKLRQWYRNLELEPNAPLAEVESAYQRLLAKYDPDRHRDDPEKHRAAKKLVAGLGEAYYGLRDHLESR